MFITVSDFWPTILMKLNFTMDVFPGSFTNLARAVISYNNGCFYVKGFYNFMSVFALKICCKTFRKTTENPVKDCNFLVLSGFFI